MCKAMCMAMCMNKIDLRRPNASLTANLQIPHRHEVKAKVEF